LKRKILLDFHKEMFFYRKISLSKMKNYFLNDNARVYMYVSKNDINASKRIYENLRKTMKFFI
jgi:hypothetical protein